MTREASVETLRRLAEASELYERKVADIECPDEPESIQFREALAAYRSEIAPLRTRAEVDAEIVKAARDPYFGDGMSVAILKALCREPTRDSGPSSVDKEQWQCWKCGQLNAAWSQECGRCNSEHVIPR